MPELLWMNELLAAEDDRLTAVFEAPRMPVTFILSQPRAASTLFVQLAFSTMNVGYVSNLLARFWKAPYHGARLQKQLEDPDYVSSFKTQIHTAGAAEPHEWGWFWRHRLALGQGEFYLPAERAFDEGRLRAKLAGIEHALEAPLLFDNVFARNNLGRICGALPRVLAVHLFREPYWVCNSVLNARVARHGHVKGFYAELPRDRAAILAIADPVEQVVAQVHAIETEIRATVAALDPQDLFRVDYEELVAAPLSLMQRFAGFLAERGALATPRVTMPEIRLASRNRSDLVRPEWRERLDTAYRQYFGEAPPCLGRPSLAAAVSG